MAGSQTFMFRAAVINRCGNELGIQIEDRSGSWEVPNPIIWYFPSRECVHLPARNRSSAQKEVKRAENRIFSKVEGIIL